MEPTSYLFPPTPNQWGILQNLVNETGQDMRSVITAALVVFQDSKTLSHIRGSETRQNATLFPLLSTPKKRIELMQQLRSVWRQDTGDFIGEVEEGRREWDRRVATLSHRHLHTTDTDALIYYMGDDEPEVFALMSGLFKEAVPF